MPCGYEETMEWCVTRVEHKKSHVERCLWVRLRVFARLAVLSVMWVKE